jgi:hypothetical protein
MAAPIIVPEPQFCDQNGIPYSAGTLTTYVAGTSTPKPTYTDPALTALNTNPIVLNAAGRCVMWGDGKFRLVLRDALGNLIWDQPATTIVSAAMEPVVSAPTIPDALDLLGVTAAIAAEATARSNADSAEQSARIAADNAEAATRAAADTAETNARTAADNTLTTNLNNEIARAEAAENNLQTQLSSVVDLSTSRQVSVTTDSAGNFTASWSPAFSHAVKQNSNGSAFVHAVSPLAAQAGANFTNMTMYLDHCSGTLTNRDGLLPSPSETPYASATFVFRVDGW